ncbi:restriction endonuclease [Steroidobacter cummioxidans]|uniref:restriction endonuclease n=1 Tax=Steroidobacter cummioxidans TaxID=1803913 RepID=UPI0019D4B3FD|nr:restriction endonuclease [Steroidobacter cummioxidans]
MTSSVQWKEYQQRSADFFRRLGLTATIESAVEGVRAVHSVDVLVQGKYQGIEFRWIVECKAWASNVPKEKVMALAAIVQDVGADRGFLLSETGFQSGAVRAATKTNITLASLADLNEATHEHLIDAAIGGVNWRRFKAYNRLRDIKEQRYEDEYFPPMTRHFGALAVLELMLQDAASNKYPIIYDQGRKGLATLDELLAYADEVISAAEQWSPRD